ncbi:MAG: hypothetical protein ACRD3W_29425, partial [Terriglobales bacterium]
MRRSLLPVALVATSISLTALIACAAEQTTTVESSTTTTKATAAPPGASSPLLPATTRTEASVKSKAGSGRSDPMSPLTEYYDFPASGAGQSNLIKMGGERCISWPGAVE